MSQKLDMCVYINMYLHILGEKLKNLSQKLKQKDNEISSKKEIVKYMVRPRHSTANGQCFKRKEEIKGRNEIIQKRMLPFKVHVIAGLKAQSND